MRLRLLNSGVLVGGLVLVAPSAIAHAQASTNGAAGSGDHPLYMPSRDVTVIYDVEPEGAPSPQRVKVLFAGNGRLMRIDAPDGQGSTIMDRDRQVMQIVIGPAKVYMDVPESQQQRSPFLLDPAMQYTATGTATVAGLPCNTWSIITPPGTAHACVTTDGVVLSEDGVDSQGARGHLIARTVTYAPLPPDAFQPPSGYTRVAHPEGPAAFERGGAGPQGDVQPGGPQLGTAPMGAPAGAPGSN